MEGIENSILVFNFSVNITFFLYMIYGHYGLTRQLSG